MCCFPSLETYAPFQSEKRNICSFPIQKKKKLYFNLKKETYGPCEFLSSFSDKKLTEMCKSAMFCIENRCNHNRISLCSGFRGIYDVEHFIKSLRYDVRIVESIPEIRVNGKTKKIKAFQVEHDIYFCFNLFLYNINRA